MKTQEEEFQDIIGYKFKDIKLLKRALTHSSFANECQNPDIQDNERLEFLGDAVLEVVSSEFLFKRYDEVSEGELTKLRASIVCEPTLYRCAADVDLGRYLYIGRGVEASGGRNSMSVCSDAMEAVIGALYLDGGIDAASEWIHRVILNDIEKKRLFFDSKTSLQELTQAAGFGTPEYKVTGMLGPSHSRVFTVDIYILGKKITGGRGTSKKQAQQDAAHKVLEMYGDDIGRLSGDD